MEIKQGDIFWVNFDPAVGHEYKKKRPAIIVQGEVTDTTPLVTLLPLSSQLENWHKSDIFVEKDSKNKLMKDSIVKVQQISSFDKKRLIGKIGEANSPTLRKVRGYLRKHFKL